MNKKALISFLTLFSLMGSCAFCETEQEELQKTLEQAATYYNEAIDLYQQDDVNKSIDYFEKAIKEAIRVSKQFIVITVPSKEDNNPEHIHLLTKDKLTQFFNNNGVTNLKFGGVNGHLFLVAKK